MIFVDRSAVAIPDVLTSPGAVAARKKIVDLLSTFSSAHLNQLRITLDFEIWRRARPALLDLFHGKCAYCETPLVASFGDIDHFRPKHDAASLRGDRYQHHYAWLAYEWDNLLIACQACNRPMRTGSHRHGKGALFPVDGSRARLLASVDECRKTEKALLIDPCFDDPNEHLIFDEMGTCSSLTEKGLVSIEVFNLNRESLVVARRQVWLSTKESLLTNLAAERGILELRQPSELFGPQLAYSAAARASARDLILQLTKTREPEPVPLVVPRREVSAHQPRRYRRLKTLPLFAHHGLTRIEIRNFKGIGALDFDFPEAPVEEGIETGALMLIGENATGKSTFLEAIALALLGTDQIAALGVRGLNYLPQWERDRKRAETSGPTAIRVYFEGTDEPVSLTIDPSSGQFVGNRKLATLVLGYGPRRFFVNVPTPLQILGGLARRKRSRDAAARVQTLFDPLATIANPAPWLKTCSQPQFDASVRALRQVLLLPDEAMVKRPPRKSSPDAEILLDVQGSAAPLTRLSEGYKTLVATSVDIIREMLRFWPDLEIARGVVLIDELETHLHPRWKMRIVQRLRRAFPRIQFITTTHDPLCLRGLYDGEVQVLQREPTGDITRVSDLPNVRGLTVEQLLTSEFFGLFSTEDPAVEEEISRYVALASKRDRTPAEELEMESHRAAMAGTLRLGTTPVEGVIQEALREFLIRSNRVGAPDRQALRRDAIEKIVEYWRTLGAKENQ